MMQVLAEDPVLLIERGAPRLIHDDLELRSYTEVLFRLTGKEETTPAEQETVALLTLLVEQYESKYRLALASPVDVLRYLIEKGGLTQADLRPELGSPANVSMVLSGQRNISVQSAVALAARFGLEVSAFLPRPSAPVPARQSQRPRLEKAITGRAKESKSTQQNVNPRQRATRSSG